MKIKFHKIAKKEKYITNEFNLLKQIYINQFKIVRLLTASNSNKDNIAKEFIKSNNKFFKVNKK